MSQAPSRQTHRILGIDFRQAWQAAIDSLRRLEPDAQVSCIPYLEKNCASHFEMATSKRLKVECRNGDGSLGFRLAEITAGR